VKATKFVCAAPFVLVNALKNNNMTHNNNNAIKRVNEIFFFLEEFSGADIKSINRKKIIVAFFVNKFDLDIACDTEIETYELRDKKFKFKLIDLYAEYYALNQRTIKVTDILLDIKQKTIINIFKRFEEIENIEIFMVDLY
jgi:hypothetical protein